MLKTHLFEHLLTFVTTYWPNSLSRALPVILSCSKQQKTLLVTSQHCFELWLGSWWHQAIKWTSIEEGPWHHIASLGHNELNVFLVTQCTVTCSHDSSIVNDMLWDEMIQSQHLHYIIEATWYAPLVSFWTWSYQSLPITSPSLTKPPFVLSIPPFSGYFSWFVKGCT